MNEPLRPFDPAGPPQCGGRIRELRRKAGLTLQVLADQAGISTGFLSQVERDKAAPSLGTLAALGSALGVDVDVFISTPKPADSITRAGERPRFAIDNGSLQYERLSTTLPGGIFTALMIHIPVGYASEVAAHTGEELIVVLEGTLRQSLGDTVMVLHPGDSLHFMGDTPHSFANIGDAPARLLWTGTAQRLFGGPPDMPQRGPSAANRSTGEAK